MHTHQPKGSMCLSCKNNKQNCSALPFDTMPVIEIWKGIKIVRCKNYDK